MGKVVKRLIRVDPETFERKVLARFWLEGNEVKSEWFDESMKRYCEEDGIVVAEGVFRLRDGERFFRNLELAFSQSSFVYVDEETWGEHHSD